ncbi:MAG: protein kinase [Candidatus Acidiferrales bacterium]|jgi:serine/threonine-protein kinase
MTTPKNIGRYEIIEELGHGAMGTVYRAKDPAMDRVVALKTIIAVALVSQQGSEFRERFYREARAAGKLAHPGIVPVFDVGEHEGLPFLVMEFIEGRTLEDAAKSGERLTLERVCEIGQQTAEALGYAHRNGVVHRDIKPANILLTSAATYGIERPKITDFGVAKVSAGSNTISGQLLGTPAFMPPEQFTGATVDGRADIFSLGVILYWLATGEQPFPGETLTAVSYKVVHTEPVPPAKLNPSIPPVLEGVILKCLAKAPAARYQTGEELARDLADLRAGTNAASLQRTAMRLPLPGETDATLDAHGRTAPQNASVTPPPQVAAAPAAGNKGIRLIPAAVLLITLLAGGWYVLRGRHSSAANESSAVSVPAVAATSPSSEAPVPSRAAASVPVKPVNGESSKQPSGTAAGSPAKLSTASSGAPPGKATAVSDEPAAGTVDFDPKSLDSNANAKLRIDPPRVPGSVEFTVEMNGKKYYQWSGSGNKSEYQNLFVPPGVHEFRVVGRTDDAKVASNIVSTEFRAKKRKTLKIELRNQSKAARGTDLPLLSADSQIFVTLK